ncbi:hypothetical protein [Burkholderia ubonensis]|uniref:hypothetical protein n=1 Tax=Burkholderia ubonensis TaxID=101571 RepID=UPI000A68C256|nr:hypothetical protein [Burkholderia ubonensis]
MGRASDGSGRKPDEKPTGLLVFGIEHLGHIDVRWGDGACTRIEWWARDTTLPALAAPCRR